jgi:hypothetical protein
MNTWSGSEPEAHFGAGDGGTIGRGAGGGGGGGGVTVHFPAAVHVQCAAVHAAFVLILGHIAAMHSQQVPPQPAA